MIHVRATALKSRRRISHLLAVAASKLVDARSRTVTNTMSNFVAIVTLHLNAIGDLTNFLRTSTSNMSKF